MFNTMISFSGLIMVYMALCHHELLPFLDEKNHNFYDKLSLNQVILIINKVILIRTVSNLFKCFKSTKISFPSFNKVYIAIFLKEFCPLFMKFCHFFAMFRYSLPQVISNGI